jgi:DNA polymerase III subunit alpha
LEAVVSLAAASVGSDKDGFVHLHVHTEYSMLDGAARLNAMFAECEKSGMTAIAITDHGNVYGGYDFWTKARAAGIKPIIGIEAYVAPEHRGLKQPVRWGTPAQKDDDVSGAGAYTHMTLLAETTEGMHNLFKLSSLASLEGYFRKPRVDRELLARHAKGLIATTGCPSGEVQTRLRLGHERQAMEAAAAYRDIFGPGNFFVELMDHGLDIELRAREGLRRIARDLALPYVATNDLHYARQEDASAHEALLCVQTATNLADPNRFKFDGNGYYVKSPQQMRAVSTDEEWQAGCDSTLLIAERADVQFTKSNLMPKFPLPEGETESSWFRKEVWSGMDRRYPDGYDDQRRKQAEYEIGVIEQMGFCSYFLVVADFIMWAKRNGIRVGPCRGSAGGSIASYALGITDLDPIAHGLVFERFLNPERVSMPDVDVDFDERRRGDVIRYVTEKYGDDRVAQIITYGTIKAKAAIKDASRVLGFPYALGDRITKAFPPPVLGKEMPLSGVFETEHPRYGEAAEIRALYEAEPEIKQVIDTARGLEGLIRQAGVHAAGVIMSSEPLLDHIPVWKREADGAVITQFDYPSCEDIGLLKMDFLGLRNLTVIDDAISGIKENRGTDIDLETLGLDDKLTYDLLARGDTLGVFQLDGSPMRALLRSMRTDKFGDISAVIALYRPGPMASAPVYADRKTGRAQVIPIHPELAEPLADILGESYGLMVYQEDVMFAAQKLAGYSPGKADLLRRAMGKKKKEILEKEYEPFAAGMKANGYSDGAIKTIWDVMVPFSGYAFNKAHAAGYGLISYWTAYLKANFPAEYMAGLLTSVAGDKDKSALYLAECRRMGIKVLPPDVNASRAMFTAVGDDIRFGMAAVRNVGAAVVESIAEARRSKGAFTSFADFLRKVPVNACNKRVVESLVKAGGFDSFGHPRKGLTLIHEQAIDAVIDVKRNEAIGQDSLFGDDTEVETAFDVPVPEGEWDKSTLLGFEREMLGLYVSDHPLLGMEHMLEAETDCSVAELIDSAPAETGEISERSPRADRADGQIVNVGGILSGVQRKVTKQGAAWAAATLEDLAGAIEVMFFPATYQTCMALVVDDAVVVVKGRLDRREEVPKLVAMDVKVPEMPTEGQGPFVVSITEARCVPPVIERLREVLRTHPGPAEVHLKLTSGSRAKVLRLDDKLRVKPSPSLLADLKQLLGPACAG